jgi:hypothetical protein
MNPATKRLFGPRVEVDGRSHLLDAAGVQHDDLVGHSHGFDLVMRHVDRRGA